MKPMFKHDDFEFGYRIALGSVAREYADAGEVLAIADRIKDGDADAWVREWTAAAEVNDAAAQTAQDAGHRLSARRYYLRATNYYATGLYLISHSSAPERQGELWTRSRAAWDRAVDLLPVPAERVQIPYEDTTLPGYFFRAPDAQPGERRPLVVMNNGSDGATSHLGFSGGFGANDRGYHWLAFDGPGQQSALFQQGIPFRHDWEAVLTPVMDEMLQRPDVDAERIGLIGISQAGYWVPRALAFEHRFAAAVADPGVVEVSSSWTEQLPGFMRTQLDDPSKKEAFDKEMGWTERFSKSTRATLHFRGEPYGLHTDSRYDLYQEVLKYRLGDEVKDITTPLLITDPEDEQFWPEQSEQLYEMLTGPRELVKFTAQEGANGHCEPMAPTLRETRIYDWLDGYLA
jgi:Prolyl oligopeptidase family